MANRSAESFIDWGPAFYHRSPRAPTITDRKLSFYRFFFEQRGKKETSLLFQWKCLFVWWLRGGLSSAQCFLCLCSLGPLCCVNAVVFTYARLPFAYYVGFWCGGNRRRSDDDYDVFGLDGAWKIIPRPEMYFANWPRKEKFERSQITGFQFRVFFLF